jgi:site-specific recombinase XerD
MTDLVPASESALVQLQQTSERARDFIAQGQAASTVRAYRNDWADFTTWCQKRGRVSLPALPATVALYVTDLAAPTDPSQSCLKVSTIQRRLASISQAHKLAGHENPTASAEVRAVMKGIRRELGTAQARKQPAVTEVLRAMVEHLPDTLLGRRDHALLLVGFAGAFRRSELVALTVTDVRFAHEGLIVTLRRSKTDQEGQGTTKGITYGSNPDTCPVRALQRWIADAQLTDGPLFRSMKHGKLQPGGLDGRDVARLVKRSAKGAGLDPTHFSGHSLRAGLATAAAAAGVSERAIMNQTGHKSLTVMRRYIREGSLFRDNPSGQVGL